MLLLRTDLCKEHTQVIQTANESQKFRDFSHAASPPEASSITPRTYGLVHHYVTHDAAISPLPMPRGYLRLPTPPEFLLYLSEKMAEFVLNISILRHLLIVRDQRSCAGYLEAPPDRAPADRQ